MDQHHISQIVSGIKKTASAKYLESAANRGINPGLLRSITGHGLDKHQTKLYSDLAKAYTKESQHASKANEKHIKDLQHQFEKSFTDSKKAHTASLKQNDASNKHFNKHEAHMKTTEKHQNKLEQSSANIEKHLVALLKKDTTVNVTAVGATITSHPPAHVRSR
jgi:predicted HTH transcriptional regulator